MLEKIIFFILSATVLGSALLVVLQRNLFRAALFLVVTLAGVAGLFVLLEAGFLAMMQIFVYAGAIAILILFAVMLTRRVMNPDQPQLNEQQGASFVLALLLFVLLALMLSPDQITLPFNDLKLGGIPWQESGAAVSTGLEGIRHLGQSLVDSEGYVVPFEVTSVLLLVAMVGAVYIVFPRRKETPTDADITSVLPGAEE